MVAFEPPNWPDREDEVLAPYAMTVLGFIRKRRLGKPALGAAALLGALGWNIQRKRAQQVAY